VEEATRVEEIVDKRVVQIIESRTGNNPPIYYSRYYHSSYSTQYMLDPLSNVDFLTRLGFANHHHQMEQQQVLMYMLMMVLCYHLHNHIDQQRHYQ
jgi:hypothetical protein